MKVLRVLILMFWVVVFANAQNAYLNGIVTDELGAVIPNAEIKVEERNGEIFSIRSKYDGTYRLELKNGIYQIEIIKQPFQSFIVVDYLVKENQERQLNVALLCKDCKIIEDYFTSEPTEIIQIPEIEISEKISGKPLENMPKAQNKTNRKNKIYKQ